MYFFRALYGGEVSIPHEKFIMLNSSHFRGTCLVCCETILNWKPTIQLKEGLIKTIHYFKHLDLRNYKRPTKHTAHKNSEADQEKKKQRVK